MLTGRSVRSRHAPVTLRVPFAAASVAVARQQLKKWMSEQGSPRDDVEDARVILSELVANSVRHAQPMSDGNILINWCMGPRGLELSVTDGGSTTSPHTVNAGASALAGRGMSIVESVALSWWADETRSRSTVYAILATR